MVVEAAKGFGVAESGEDGGSWLRPSSMPVVASETLSAETSAQPPLQVPLSYANRSIVIFLTAAGSMPGSLVVSSSIRLSV